MAVSVTIAVDGKNYGFDFSDYRMDVDATVDRLDVRNLWLAIKNAQDDPEGMTEEVIASAEGLTTLSSGIATFLTVRLVDPWEVNTLKTSGKFEVSGGNLVRIDSSDPFRDNPLITYINNLSQAGVQSTVSTGSGLSPEQDQIIRDTKAKTDQLTFTQANNVDANIQYVNDGEVSGTGNDGDEWGP